ncbi:MAG: rane fusion protein multidrug efflux system [Aliidongia sp.]|jgi:multidrug efflux system membrane fusion protein|nr:rane fusion protein multidrug efflux system [Aliidongia sp.]
MRKSNSSLTGAIGHTRLVLFGVGGLFLLALTAGGILLRAPQSRAAPPRLPQAVAVDTAIAAEADVPVYLGGIGTVQAFYTVTITPRVDGELTKIGFVEGQTVKPGDFLAQIDPRPYQAAFDQAVATKDKDAAQLANAQRDLERYVTLAPQNFTSKQILDTQRALVAQLTAQVKGDQAAIDNAKTNLDYTTITSPIPGRTGIRLIDPGNNLHAASTAGIVVVTQIQPISVIFTLPEDALLDINAALASGPVAVTALSQDGKTELDRGTLMLVDNQIDQTTGTLRLKASFPNKANRLWPGEFVNTKTLQSTRHKALTIPSTALQRGPGGVFCYVVTPDSKVEMRPLETAQDADGVAVVTSGLTAGERVTTSNEYRLQPGIPVSVKPVAASAKP